MKKLPRFSVWFGSVPAGFSSGSEHHWLSPRSNKKPFFVIGPIRSGFYRAKAYPRYPYSKPINLYTLFITLFAVSKPRNKHMEPSACSSSELHVWRKTVAAGSSKQQVNDTGDNESSSSEHKLESNDDLLIEILLRLPLISLRLFKSVCKRWLSLITDPSFTLLRSRNPNFDPPSGFFLQRCAATSEFDFVPLDSRIPIKSSPLITSFNFELNSGDFEVLQSCNGLLLCCFRPDKFYVYNPTLNLSKLLPLPHVWEPNRIMFNMAIAFDPAVSPHYKVLYPLDDFTSTGVPIHIEIYYSETNDWRICVHRFPFESFEGFHDVIYWQDAVHWIDNSDGFFHFNLDLENPHFIQVETPRTLNGGAYWDGKLLDSCNRLLLVELVQPLSLQMNVYEMKNDYSGWSIIYRVDLDDICTKFPGFFKFFPKRSSYDLLC